MRFTVLASLLFSSLALAAPSAEQKGFEVVIHYVDAPDCDVTCGANTTSTSESSTIFSTTSEETSTFTETSTKYVIVTLQTGAGTTETLGYETATTSPVYETAVPAPTY